jgi:antitoxin ParD1/3/4
MGLGVPDMTSMNISLPDSLKQFVDEQISTGAYGSANDYVVRLISEAQDRKYREEIEQKVLEALDRGDYSPMSSQEWEDLRAEIRDRAELRERQSECK